MTVGDPFGGHLGIAFCRFPSMFSSCLKGALVLWISVGPLCFSVLRVVLMRYLKVGPDLRLRRRRGERPEEMSQTLFPFILFILCVFRMLAIFLMLGLWFESVRSTLFLLDQFQRTTRSHAKTGYTIASI